MTDRPKNHMLVIFIFGDIKEVENISLGHEFIIARH